MLGQVRPGYATLGNDSTVYAKLGQIRALCVRLFQFRLILSVLGQVMPG